MKIHIKNMVCDRCIKVVKDELDKLGLKIRNIALGEVELERSASPEELQQIKLMLLENGFELIDDRQNQIIEEIKRVIIKHIHIENETTVNLSTLLEQSLSYDYSYLSNLFSSVEGVTIEKYAINQKIERAKELLIYDELNLSQIADRLNYSSVQHLSRQFKKVTGLTPSHFKKIGENRRKPIDKV